MGVDQLLDAVAQSCIRVHGWLLVPRALPGPHVAARCTLAGRCRRHTSLHARGALLAASSPARALGASLVRILTLASVLIWTKSGGLKF